MSLTRYAARLIALGIVAAVVLVALITAAVPAGAVSRAPSADDPVCTSPVTVTPCAQGQLDSERIGRQLGVASSFGTLAQRDRYIACVAPSTEVSYTLRVKLLTYAGRALEGIRAGVPAYKVTAVLRAEYHLTATEASRVYWCTMRVWG